jgi:hypothetical protein
LNPTIHFEQPRKTPIAELANALRAHVETLKGDVARLEDELMHAQARADRATAELTALAPRYCTGARSSSSPNTSPVLVGDRRNAAHPFTAR